MQTTSSIQTSACPVCGSWPMLVDVPSDIGTRAISLRCQQCGLRTVDTSRLQDAVSMWNGGEGMRKADGSAYHLDPAKKRWTKLMVVSVEEVA